MIKKVMGLKEAANLIKSGHKLAMGGNSLHRNPATLCFELATRGLKNLKLYGAAQGLGSDVLCATESVDTIAFGFFGFENEYGLAPGMRKGCQEGKIKALEGP